MAVEWLHPRLQPDGLRVDNKCNSCPLTPGTDLQGLARLVVHGLELMFSANHHLRSNSEDDIARKSLGAAVAGQSHRKSIADATYQNAIVWYLRCVDYQGRPKTEKSVDHNASPATPPSVGRESTQVGFFFLSLVENSQNS